MNNRFSLQQISETGNLDFNLISRQYTLNLMVKYMEIKFESPKLKESETADQLCYSSSFLQRYRNDINKLSPYRIQPNITNKRTEKTSNTHFDNDPHGKLDIKRPQTISNDVVEPETKTKSSKKIILKAGFVHRIIEINDKYLEEILHNNNL